MEASADSIATKIVSNIKKALIYEMPEPSCPLKKQKHIWKIKEVKKLVAEKLNNDQ